MKTRKILLGCVALCVVVITTIILLFLKNGLRWSLPEKLLSRFDFDRMNEMVDQMRSDGFSDLSNHLGEQTVYYLFAKADGDSATPLIYLEWKINSDEFQSWHEQYCDVKTSYVRNVNEAPGNKYEYRYRQEVYVNWGRGRLWMVYYTERLFEGQRQVVDFLYDFCDKYCSVGNPL